MAGVGSANVNITADDSQARDEMSGFLGFMRKTGSIASGIVAGVAAFEGIKNGIVGAWQSTIGANSSLEKYHNTLQVVLGSSQKATEMLAWAEEFASSTPFEIPQIVEAATLLEAYGLKAQEVMGLTGDMASVMNKDLTQAVEAVADAQAGELERLKEFGITKRQIIEQAKEMGIGDVVDAQGSITDMKAFNEALFALMEDRFKGGMKLQSQTFSGLISNAKDSMGVIFRTVSQPVFDSFKSNLKSLGPILSAAASYIRGDISTAMDTLSSKFGEGTAGKIMNFFNSFKQGLLNAKNYIMRFKPTVQNLIDIVKGLAPTFEVIGGAIAVAFQKIADVLPPILTKITAMAEAIVEWEAFTPIVTGLAAGFVALKAANAAAAGIRAVQFAISIMMNPMARAIFLTNMWKRAQMFLNATLLANPITAIIAGLVALGVALYVAYQKSETFRNIVNSAWASIKAGFQAFINFFTTTLPAWVVSVVVWFTNLKTRAVVIFNTLKLRALVLFRTMIRNIILFFVNLFTSVVSYVTNLKNTAVARFNQLKVLVISTIIIFVQRVIQFFLNLYTNVLSYVTNLKNTAVARFNQLKVLVISAVIRMVQRVIQFFVNLYNNARSKVDQVKNAVSNGFNRAKDAAVSAVRGLYNSVRDWLSNVVGKFQDLKDDVISKVSSINLYDIGRDIIQGLLNGLGSMYTAVKRKVGDIMSAVGNVASKVLLLGSPSRLFDRYGRWTFEGFVRGMDHLKGAVKKKSEEVLGGAIPNVKKLVPKPAMNLGNFMRSTKDRFNALPFMRTGNGQEVHNHYWNVDADQINEVQKLTDMIYGLRQDRRKS